MDDYKVKQLQLMLEHEESADGGYGVPLYTPLCKAKPINLDSGALKVLIEYYSKD